MADIVAGNLRIRRNGNQIQVSVDSGTTWLPFTVRGPGITLTDADATINPGTDKSSLYVLPPGTLTAPRTLTVGNGGSPLLNHIIFIQRLDRSAFTYAVQNAVPTNLITLPGSPTVDIEYATYHNGTNFLPWQVNYLPQI